MAAAWQETNAALRDSERRYRDLVEHSLGLICTHDLAGTILSINPAAAASLGYRPEDGIGRNLRDFLATSKQPLFDEYLRRVRAQGSDAGLMSVVSRTGSMRVWMYRNVLSQHPDGTPCVLGHAIDVTERVAVERALRAQEQALRAARDELEGRVRERTLALEHANQRLRIEMAEREKAERSREQALIEQRDVLAFLSRFSDRLASLLRFDELIKAVRELPVPYLADWTVLHLVNDDGSIRCVPGVHTESALEPTLSALAWAARELPRSSCIAEVIATGRPAWIPSTSPELASTNIGLSGDTATLMRLGTGAAAVLPLVADKKIKGALSLVASRESRVTWSDALLADISRRIRLALDRIQLYREAEQANRLKDDFLSTLSHELRTPLNAIFGWARILKGYGLDKRSAHAVAVIERNAEAQIRLIEEILDVSRIVTGKMALKMESVSVPAIAGAVIETLRPGLQSKRIRFERQIAEDIPPVIGDAHRLQQVFWNLLSNALKFTPPDGVITLTVRRSSGGVEFTVADTGIGIRPEVLPFVFDRFRQADSSTSRAHGGLGLGLAIVKHIVELHGGTVQASSAGEGRGATFTILLLEAEAGAGAMHGPRAELTKEASGGTSPLVLDGHRILVVEDHDDARELIVAVLEAAGARVDACATTRPAVQRAKEVRPDMLVADLGLPGEDGYALLEEVRALYPLVPAIALTAYARASDRERALAAGFQEHVVKPMDPDKLTRIIASFLHPDSV